MIIQETPTLNAQFDKANNDSDMLSLLKSQGGTFTRGSEVVGSGASVASYVDALGTLRYAKLGHPRPNFIDGVNQGLLIEEERTNLLQRSEQFDNAYWVKGSTGDGVTPVVTANAGIAPDGNMTADRIVFDIATTAIDSSSSINSPAVSPTVASSSIWLKSNTSSSYTMRLRTKVTSVLITVTPEWQIFSTSADNASTEGLNLNLRVNNASFGGTSNYADVLVFGAQLEAVSFPTSYIPTAGTTVTRGADNALIDGTAFTDFYNQNEGTFFIDLELFNTINNGRILSESIGGFPRYIGVDSGGILRTFDGAAYSPYQTNIEVNTQYKIGMKYKNTASMVVNGGAIITNTYDVNNFFATTLRFLTNMNGVIKRIVYYPKALTEAELQLLSRI